MKLPVLGLIAGALLTGPIGANAASVIVGSKEWRQVTDTIGFSWNAVAAECDPLTGVCKPNYADEEWSTVCSGPYEGPCFGGWTWASNEDIQALFEALIRPDSIQFPTPTTNYVAENEPDIEAAVGGLFSRTGSVIAVDIVWGWSRSAPATGSCAYAPFLESGGFYDGVHIADRAVLDNCWSPDRGSEAIGVWFYRPVSESGTLALLGLGLAGLGLSRRRKAN